MSITLPGSIPDLLRRCSPAASEHYGHGVVLSVSPDRPGIARGFAFFAPDAEPDECSVVPIDLDRVALDLADDAGATRAGQWASRAMGWSLDRARAADYLVGGGGQIRGLVMRACCSPHRLTADDRRKLRDACLTLAGLPVPEGA